MAAPIKVTVFGATGRTGGFIVDGLLSSETKFVRGPITPPSSPSLSLSLSLVLAR